MDGREEGDRIGREVCDTWTRQEGKIYDSRTCRIEKRIGHREDETQIQEKGEGQTRDGKDRTQQGQQKGGKEPTTVV